MTVEQTGLIWGGVAALSWGGFFAFSHLGVGAGFDAADLAFLRYGTAGALMLPWLLRNSVRSLGSVGWLHGIALALLAGPPFVLVSTTGFAFAPLAHGAVIQLGTATLMGTVLAAIFLGERVGIMRASGVTVMVAGLAITVGPSLLDGGTQAWKGDLLFAGAGLMWALFTLLQRRWTVDPLAITAVISILALLSYVPGYLLIRGPQALIAANPLMVLQLAIVLGVLSGIVALFAFGRSVSCLGAARASLFPALAPGVAILLGVPLAGEIPTLPQVGGLIILTAGLLLSIRQGSAHLKASADLAQRQVGDSAELGAGGASTEQNHWQLGHCRRQPMRCVDTDAEHEFGFMPHTADSGASSDERIEQKQVPARCFCCA